MKIVVIILIFLYLSWEELKSILIVGRHGSRNPYAGVSYYTPTATL